MTFFPECHLASTQTLSCRPNILSLWDLEMRLTKAEPPSEWHAHALQPDALMSVLTCIRAAIEARGRLQLMEQPASGSALVSALCYLGLAPESICSEVLCSQSSLQTYSA